MVTLLVADIGGTKSELAIYSGVGSGAVLLQKRYTNADFTRFEEIAELFLAEIDHVPRVACIAVAGVVSGETAMLTNLPWRVDCRLLEQRFGIQRVLLINDLTAVCSSLPELCADDLFELQAGAGAGGQIRGVIAPGTGLGEGMLVEVGGKLLARGSEGGHTDFGPVDEEQLALLAWMHEKEKPVSYEMLIAGPGLANLYDFCRTYYKIPETPSIVDKMAHAQDRIPFIVGGAIAAQSCPLCRRAIELFLSILGSEAGNLALKLYAKGGIYLGGGILPRLMGKVSFDGFLKSFRDKGLMSGFMKNIPVHLILRKDAALLGAVRFAREELRE
jgi:glucokinase